jgi:hypothetical protein
LEQKHLAGEDGPDEVIVEAVDPIQVLVNTLSSFCDEEMKIGVKVEPGTEGLDDNCDAGSELSSR